jgi:hypothetical protein
MKSTVTQDKAIKANAASAAARSKDMEKRFEQTADARRQYINCAMFSCTRPLPDGKGNARQSRKRFATQNENNSAMSRKSR